MPAIIPDRGELSGGRVHVSELARRLGISRPLLYMHLNRPAGRDNREALRIAAGTSGRAILVSGLTVMIALSGLFITVFILSRVRELRSRGGSTRAALVGGIAGSAGVVTSAAVIMVAVFSILATLPIVDTRTLGVGLAAAVLIDATVVRGILLPSAMALLGERCWYLPRWLSWVPGRCRAVPGPSAPSARNHGA